MKLRSITIRNFRRLESVQIDVDERESIFVGPNNSGKTSATAIFRSFLGGRGFKIHDFSASKIPEIDAFIEQGREEALPKISLDLWFKIDPATTPVGRVFSLLPRAAPHDHVGLRLSFEIADPKRLRETYLKAYPSTENETRKRSLSQYLSIDSNLARHSTVKYFKLDAGDGEIGGDCRAIELDPEEGRRLIKSLVQVEFVDAQRNITDDDSSRSNRLSSAFASFYRKNLEQAEHAAAAHAVVDENNKKLTEHYAVQFEPLLNLIRKLGVPSINDRELKIVSSLSPEEALQGSTDLLYVDSSQEHELPELYNGLGFKNLIYMAVQARHFHSQWIRSQVERPLCLLIFIEEPEVHLHAQVQQAFITNIWAVIDQSAAESGEPNIVPQLIITTHSSHILEAVAFGKVRHFQRCAAEGGSSGAVLNATRVNNLRSFIPEPVEEQPEDGDRRGGQPDGLVIASAEALNFLQRYLRLTHCDLFFADAAILVEGAAEKILLPEMIRRTAPRLNSTYVTILEVGGAYAHRFHGLLKFLCIPYLIITDLDSTDPANNRKMCRADTSGAKSSNVTLKKFFGDREASALASIPPSERESADGSHYVTTQSKVVVRAGEATKEMIGRTFEEAIAYENFDQLRDGTISIGKQVPENLGEAYQIIYDRVASSSFKKTEFALSLLEAEATWTVPIYIEDGLKWLEKKICPPMSGEAASDRGPGLPSPSSTPSVAQEASA